MDGQKRAVVTHSARETEEQAAALAGSFAGNETVALFGGLGMGKTAFARGIAKGLGLDQNTVSSPTFAIVHEHYDGAGRKAMCHYDMYRVSGWDDIETTGFFDTTGRCVNVIEWSENIESELPLPRWEVRIERGEGEDDRLISIEYLSDQR